MGIDVYMKWQGQTQEEREAQYTGWSITHGHVGYLRETYHGGPYATRILAPEAWENNDGECRVSLETLRERMPRVLLATLLRDLMLYQGKSDPAEIKLDGAEEGEAIIARVGPMLLAKLKSCNMQPADFEQDVPPFTMYSATVQYALGVNYGWWPAHAKAYVDFFALFEEKDKAGLKPWIYVSA